MYHASKALRRAMRLFLCALAFGSLFAGVSPGQAQNVLRIAAVVNDRVISALDVVERVKFVMFSTNMANTPDNQRRLAKQILRNQLYANAEQTVQDLTFALLPILNEQP